MRLLQPCRTFSARKIFVSASDFCWATLSSYKTSDSKLPLSLGRPIWYPWLLSRIESEALRKPNSGGTVFSIAASASAYLKVELLSKRPFRIYDYKMWTSELLKYLKLWNSCYVWHNSTVVQKFDVRASEKRRTPRSPNDSRKTPVNEAGNRISWEQLEIGSEGALPPCFLDAVIKRVLMQQHVLHLAQFQLCR